MVNTGNCDLLSAPESPKISKNKINRKSRRANLSGLASPPADFVNVTHIGRLENRANTVLLCSCYPSVISWRVWKKTRDVRISRENFVVKEEKKTHWLTINKSIYVIHPIEKSVLFVRIFGVEKNLRLRGFIIIIPVVFKIFGIRFVSFFEAFKWALFVKINIEYKNCLDNTK